MEEFKSTMAELVKYQMQKAEERQQKTEERQQKFEDLLLQTLSNRGQNTENENAFSQNAVWSAIDNFTYSPDEDKTFASYFRRYEDLYKIDCENWADFKKVRLLLRKLGTTEHTKFVDYILPRKTSDLTFSEAVKLLTELFSPKTSLFHKRWKCMNLIRKDSEDYSTFASIVNKHCDDFKLAELSADNFKCLIFVQGLVSAKDAEIRRRVLNKLEGEPNLTLQKLAEDCQRFVSVKQDSKDIEESGIAHVRKIRQKSHFNYPSKTSQTKKRDFFHSPTKTSYPNKKQEKLPPSPCSRCGSLHWFMDCPYRFKTCLTCNKVGHKSSHCRTNKGNKSRVKSTKIDEQDGINIRKYVQVKILNKNVKLQLDSGSDLSIINRHTWKRLDKPTMLKTNKIARTVTGEKINFEGEIITNVTLNGTTKKLKMFVLKNTNNLFGTDWMQQFNLWDLPINTFCQKIENLTTEAEKLKKELKGTFPEVFFWRPRSM